MHIQPPKKKNKHKHKQSRTQDPVPPGRTVPRRPCALLTLHPAHPTPASCRNPLGLRPQEEEEEERGGSGAEKEEEGEKEKEGRLGATVLLRSACPSPVPGRSWEALCTWLQFHEASCLSFFCRTDTAPSTQGWAARRPAAAAACGEASLCRSTELPAPAACCGLVPLTEHSREAWAVMAPTCREHGPTTPLLALCGRWGPGDTDTAGMGVPTVGLLYLNNTVHWDLFFIHLLIKVCSEEELVPVAALTVGRRRRARSRDLGSAPSYSSPCSSPGCEGEGSGGHE